MSFCSNCGAQNSDTAKFCVNCGAALSATASEQKSAQPAYTPPPQIPQAGIGTKVSFIAADGKTYSGTIKEIQGEQYKIKYDAFDFETWLHKNQFTLIGSSNTVLTPTPTYTAAPPTYSAPQSVNPPVNFGNTPPSTTPAFLTHLGFWGSLMILIGFFTNWLNVGFFSFTGLKILTSATEVMGGEQDSQGVGVVMVSAIVIIVISAIVCILYTMGAGVGKGAFNVFKILPLLALVAMVVYLVIKSREGGNYNDDTDTSNASAWKLLGIGIYLTLAGSLVLAISRSRK